MSGTEAVVEREERANNPFGSQALAVRSGTSLISVEQQRAIAEVQAAMIIARANPRDPARATDLILADCGRPTLAEKATYEYSRGGTDINGPSIRLMETIARRWGNIECGVRELSRHEGFSECVAYAIDIETNFRDSKTFQVKHWRDTKKGGYQITDERDIYEVVANMGARRKRACLIAIIPGDVVEAAVEQCEKTLKLKIEVTAELIDSMLSLFSDYGVTKEMVEKRIQRHIGSMTPMQAVQLKRIYNSLKDGMSSPGDWFDVAPAAEGGQQEGKKDTGAAALKAAAARKRQPNKASTGDATSKTDGKPSTTDDKPKGSEQTQQGAGGAAGTPPASGDLVSQAHGDKSPVDEVRRICAAALEIKDSQTAFLRLDDARVILPSMNAEDKAASVTIIDAANEKLKARK